LFDDYIILVIGQGAVMTNIYNFGLFAAAVISETIATLMIKESAQFSKFLPSVLSIIGYILSTYLLSVIVKTVPLGIAYAIWSACGIVLITIFGIWYGKESFDFAAFLGIFLIVAGVVIIYLFSDAIR
jgi:small multidrug resistance pump